MYVFPQVAYRLRQFELQGFFANAENITHCLEEGEAYRSVVINANAHYWRNRLF